MIENNNNERIRNGAGSRKVVAELHVQHTMVFRIYNCWKVDRLICRKLECSLLKY